MSEFLTHAQWCRWLASRGSLTPNHRNCQHADRCAANGPAEEAARRRG